MSNLSELLPTGGGQNAVDFVAFENITAGQAVALRSDGQIEVADSGNFANVIGLAAEAITSGNTGAVNVFGGINEAQSGLTIGSDYYINGSGSLTTSSTSPSLKLGQAITATTINLLDFPSVLLIEGQQAYTTAGTYTWVAPAGVTSVSVVVVSGGAGDDFGGASYDRSGSGGNLGYKNSYAVTSGSSYTVVVGSGGLPAYAGSVTGGLSSFDFAGGGPKVFGGTTITNTSAASTGVDGGGRGGDGVNDSSTTLGSGGGGAGGYAGNGGSGTLGGGGTAGAGGGAGGGGWPYGGGGGVGILGQGANGTAGGGGGSGGANGGQGSGNPGLYGGGASGNVAGANGAVRIIWSNSVTRAFPSTNTGDL
jgi:hypothetical protein